MTIIESALMVAAIIAGILISTFLNNGPRQKEKHPYQSNVTKVVKLPSGVAVVVSIGEGEQDSSALEYSIANDYRLSMVEARLGIKHEIVNKDGGMK